MITGYDEVIELDGHDRMGFLLYGDVDDFDVELFMAGEEFTEAFEDHHEDGFNIIETYVRKVPILSGDAAGCMRYVYASKPGPGARKCVRLELAQLPSHWCMNHIYERAGTGIPLEQYIGHLPADQHVVWPMVQVRIRDRARVQEWEIRRGHTLDSPAYAYLCGECSTAHHARLQRARDLHMLDYHRARGDHDACARIEARLADAS